MSTDIRLSMYSHGAGCACKLGPSELAFVLRDMPVPAHPDLLVGTASGDDAAVWRVAPDRAMVATIDFFTPVVDDPATWGAIAAANAASDVYAMGGRPLFALNVAAWPRELLDLAILAEVFQGATAIASKGGWLTVGGHTVDGREPMFGQAVFGEVHPDQIMTNDAARPGQVILLTKAIGTGVVTTALKRMDPDAPGPGGRLHEAYEAAVDSMTTLNDVASSIALRYGVRAATDVTGFGLTGHLHMMARGSGVAMAVEVESLPLLPGVEQLLADGFVPGGTGRNLEFVSDHVVAEAGLWQRLQNLLADPQTSGGLALCVEPTKADAALADLLAAGLPASRIGTVIDGPAGQLRFV
jgi:selenide,water dikinase